MIYAFGAGEVPISLSGAEGSVLTHTVRDVGLATRAICRSEPGETLGVRGPFGSSWPLDAAAGRDLVIVAGGLGLAPLRSSVLAAMGAPGRFRSVQLLYGGREPDQLLYRAQLEEWLAGGVEVSLIVDAANGDWQGDVGVVTRLIDRAAFDPAEAVALVCGPEAMMRFSARALRAKGVPAERIHLSYERNMKCAVTLCGRCQLGPRFICREGPVLSLAEAEPWTAVREL